MMFYGELHKMHSWLKSPVEYQLMLNGIAVDLHEHLGKKIRIQWLDKISCIHCGRVTKKSFNQGYCYPCFKSLAQCDICIVSPEKCHFDQGTCREPDWAQDHCMQDHLVYLSNTSGVKVGITRHSQVPTRWIDQGAVQALAVIKVSKRYYAGLVETAFKEFLNDKTNWRNMLKHQYQEVDLYQQFSAIWPQVEAKLDDRVLQDVTLIARPEDMVAIEYPSLQFPEKITSLNLDKNPHIEGTLMAIKGQYLIFDTGVINIRKYAGYQVELGIS